MNCYLISSDLGNISYPFLCIGLFCSFLLLLLVLELNFRYELLFLIEQWKQPEFLNLNPLETAFKNHEPKC